MDFITSMGLTPSSETYTNLSSEELVQKTLEMGLGKLTPQGALLVKTGKHTGRAAQDKYVVSSDLSNKTIDWENDLRKMDRKVFDSIKEDVLASYKGNELFIQCNSAGADEKWNMNTVLVTPSPAHALFANHMFREKREKSGLAPYTMFHAPNLKIDSDKYGTRSETVISICLETREILIVGTLYAGEIKKSIFSMMNYILPEHGILPMHCGANLGEKGDVSVFFGLSGTGKTTLSTDTGRQLIGDDEHGLSDDGTFNFEGGCYAKTFHLSYESEPEIYTATQTKGALLENVMYNEKTGELDFEDKTLTENGRVSYPLSYIPNIVKDSRAGVPNNIFFLCADAFGVLPPVSRLTLEQAKYYFLSGYTAKLAGTEVGVKEPQATFSTCFGAPFMMRPAKEYADLLADHVEKDHTSVWLVNTGWTAGGYGEGYRFPIRVTRRIIRLAQSGRLAECDFRKEDFFGLEIPTNVEGVEEELLNPVLTWKDKEAYAKTAKHLREMFEKNYKKYL